MNKKIQIVLMMGLLSTTLPSCDQTDNSVDNGISLKYDVVDGEVVIDDENLTNSSDVEDNYRVFYEIFTGSFSDSNGDGIGDLQGIINRLDYLNDGDVNSGKSLGIQGIWLTPIFLSPTYHKYDVTDYYRIDPKFGTMQDYQNLISECHKRNIKVIMDLPFNHTGNQNLWFTEFCKSHRDNDPTNKYYDYYSYYTSGDPIPAGRSFSSIQGTNQFYECNFAGTMPELNFDNENVRNDVLEIAKYYMNMGVDGFRFDAAKYIYFGDDKKSAEFWNWYVGELEKINEDVYIVGEVWSADGSTEVYFKNGLNCFNFSTSGSEGKIANAAKKGDVNVFTSYVETYINKITSLKEDAIMMSFISNHDMDRAAGYVQMLSKQAYMAANLYLLSSGSPFIYYGEEIAMKGSRGSASSDANRRLAMLWGDEDTVEDPSEATFKSKNQINGTVVSQLADENSLLNHYKKLIMIRNAHPEIARGKYESLTSPISTVGGFISTYNGSSVCVIHNTSFEEKVLDLSLVACEDYIDLSAIVGINGATLENNTLVIGGQTSVVLKK